MTTAKSAAMIFDREINNRFATLLRVGSTKPLSAVGHSFDLSLRFERNALHHVDEVTLNFDRRQPGSAT
jgi:predicted amino acid racemase